LGGIILCIVLLVPFSLWLAYATESNTPEPISVILLIPDGTGPASWTAARQFLKALNISNKQRFPDWGPDLPEYGLFLDKFLVGTAQTYATDTLVTDSAAGATAYACCQKTYNGAIGVDVNGKSIGTLMEAAKKRNMLTGFVVTSTVTHATPASFSSHLASREDQNDIANQQATMQNLDFALGGGRTYFDPNSRPDQKDLLGALKGRGYQVLQSGDDWRNYTTTVANKKSSPFPVFGLFANSHLNYEIDNWMVDQPSLSNMTATILSYIQADHSIIGLVVGFL